MRESFSIWWFAGVLLLAYGIVILSHRFVGTESSSDPNPPVLSNLHAPIWWGALLTVAGLGYTIGFRPRSSTGNKKEITWRSR